MAFPDGYVLRCDRATLGKAEITDEGYLRAPAQLTRTGVFDYFESDALSPDRLVRRRELRLPSEVFSARSLASLEDKPLTRGHPWFERVDATTVKGVQIGHVRDVRKADDGEHVEATVIVMDSEAVAAVLAGKERQISCAYYHKREAIEGGRYTDVDGELGEKGAVIEADFIQRDIHGNHHALVELGRAGPTAEIRLDSAGNQIGDDGMDPKELLKRIGELESELKSAQKLNLDSAESAKAIATKAEAELAATRAALESARKEGAELQLKLDAAAKKEADGVKAAFVEKHATDLGVVDEATRATVLALDSAELKRRVLAKVSPELNLDGRDPAFVDAAYETAISLRPDTTTRAGAAIVDSRNGLRFNADTSAVVTAARERMEQEQRDAWKKQPGAKS